MIRSRPFGVGLLGCGVVGSAVVRRLASQNFAEVRSIAVRDLTKPRECDLVNATMTVEAMSVVEDPMVEVVIEALGGEEPANTLIRRALQLGKPVITANKTVLARRLTDLFTRNRPSHEPPLLMEAAVGGALPIIQLLEEYLANDRITRIDGVLNGTSTYVLTRMADGDMSRDKALEEAQRLGFAEADATADLDGRDASEKLVVLSRVAFEGLASTVNTVKRSGIERVTRDEIAAATDSGETVRLVATATDDGDLVVGPQRLPFDHPFSRLTGAQCAVRIQARWAGTLLLAGEGAGGEPTSAAILADLGRAADWHRGTFG